MKGDEHTGNMDYYGKIVEIIKLDYLGKNRVILLKCDWYEVPSQGRHQTRGYKKDKHGFITLDTMRTQYTDEPFVLASQAEQVYYVKDVNNSNWQTVVKVQPRNVYDIPEVYKAEEVENSIDLGEAYQQNELGCVGNFSHDCFSTDADFVLHRDDIKRKC